MSATHDNAGIAAWNFKLKGEIHSYADCERFVTFDGEVPGEFERKIGPQMHVGQVRLPWGELCYAVQLYDTQIIRYYEDGTFSVDNGGFNTITTTARLNAVMPKGFHAYHRDKKLALSFRSSTLHPLDHGIKINPETGELTKQDGTPV